jgi:hypothetical protein
MRRISDLLWGKSRRTPPAALEPVPPSTQENQSRHAEEYRQANRQHTQPYFTAMTALQQAVSARAYEEARRHALEALDHVPGFVDEWLLDSSTFGVQSIPPLEVGGIMFALLDDRAGIERIRSVAASRQQLANWRNIHAEHEESRILFRALERVVATKPGILQADLKNEVGATDGRRVSTLIGWLEKAGRIRREPNGKTYALFLSTESDASSPPTRPNLRVVGSHRRGEMPRKRKIDWSAVTHIALPRSPSRWELDPHDSREDALIEPFEIVDSQEWTALEIEKLPPSERPDPAFRKLYATGSGILALDDLGKSDPKAEAVVMRYGRGGEIEAKESLAHGVYRVGVSAMSGSFIGLSRTHVAHAYDERLRLIFETDLSKAPEVVAIQRRLGVDAAQLHTHLRSVALSDDARQYLFTVVDEAWCVGLDGVGLWGLSVPLQEGYRFQDEDAVGTQGDIQHALATLGLALPLAPDDVKQRYRALAKEWHPDVNRSPEAGARMQEINQAVSLLTGLQGDALAGYSGVRMAYKEMGSTVVNSDGVEMTMSLSMSMGEVSAADWIYASAFAADAGRAFIATYSGKVLEVDKSGKPVLYYGIGNVPRRIIDTGDYLYLLTDTRLYVLRSGTLLTLVDVSEGGDVVVSQTGFGLLEKKRFRWFDESGAQVATVLSKTPIRRVYQRRDAVIVETRTHRLHVAGARPWWE